MAYALVAVTPVAVLPSPNVQLYDVIELPGAVEALASNAQLSAVQVAANDATGAGAAVANMPRVRQSLPSVLGPLTTASVEPSGLPQAQATECRLPVAESA